MKNKQEIIREIHKLAKNITETNSEDAIIESARELYENSVLLKHLDDIHTPSLKTESKREEPLVIGENPVKPEPPKKDSIPKEPTIDLFSCEPILAEVSPEPIAEKPVVKEPKAVKNKSDESVGEKLQHKKITDLKASIGINEKFQFINELFDGNMKEYTVAVDQINSFPSLAEAQSYIANIEGVYKWLPDNQIAESFKELVKRRFA
ncbi:MAG: hypothetical protein HY840_12320 [Bacteroidetes bacterium]|nr:hypothetical protein [Bacteroidota bacterium]